MNIGQTPSGCIQGPATLPPAWQVSRNDPDFKSNPASW
jgi:hypothetical protein